MSIAKINLPVFSSDGETVRPAPEAVVTIYKTGTTTLATVYTTMAATATTGNPVSASTDGLVTAYVQPGIYDLSIVTVAGTTTMTGIVAAGDMRTIDVTATSSPTVANWGDVMQFDSTSNGAVTLPSSMPIGYVVYSTNVGGGTVTFSPAGIDGSNTGAAYTITAARHVGSNEWQLVGDVS